MQPHEQLEGFFAELFKLMREAEPSTYHNFMLRAEEEFKRTGYREKNSEGIENILIARLDVIGDMILTSGFIREVRANFPRARITLVVSPLTFPMVELCPYVNEVLSFNPNQTVGNFPDALEKIVTFCKENLWRKNFSIAFSPQWGSLNFSALLLCWISGARERIGYGTNPYKSYFADSLAEYTARGNFLLTKNIVTPQSIVAELEKHLYLLTASGFAVNQDKLIKIIWSFFTARKILNEHENF